MKEKIRIGVIGCGRISLAHREACKNLIDEVKIEAIADINNENLSRFTEGYRVPHIFNDYRKVLQDDNVDAVIVCVPHDLHEKITIDALEMKKHVLIEKPMALDYTQAKNMVNQLLVFSKGEEFLNKEIIEFTDIIEITTKFTMRGRKSRPIFDIDKDLWSIYGDPIQISQIIQNLVINADQAMSEGGIIELKAHNVELEVNNQFQLNPGKYIHFCIIDSGLGIPQNIQEKIFSPFFTTKREGKGFGLSICKKIIEDHNGYMGFHTTIGKGTEFYFYAPAKEKITQESKKQDSLKEQFSGSALILDDNFLVLRVIENLFKILGMTAISSSESSTFLSTYKNIIERGEDVDLLIVDLTLPGDFGGKAIIEKIRNINPNAYVVVSSGYSDDFVMKNYRNYGFNDFLRKPFNKEELVKVLKKCFEKKSR